MPENTKMQNLISSVMTKFSFDKKLTYQENMKLLLSVILNETIATYDLKSASCGKNRNHMQDSLLSLSKDVSSLATSKSDYFHEVKEFLYFGQLDKVMSMFNKMMMSIFDAVAEKFKVHSSEINKRKVFV